MYFQSFVLQMNELLTIYYQHLCNQWFGLLHMLHIERMEPCRVYSGNLLHYSGLFRTILHCTFLQFTSTSLIFLCNSKIEWESLRLFMTLQDLR